MMIIFDANALIAFANIEPGASVVESYLLEPAYTCFVHAANLCEFFYDGLKRRPLEEVNAALDFFRHFKLITRYDMDDAFWREAAEIKAQFRRVSLADCFAIVLTQRLDGMLVTSDHKELDPIAQAGICRIKFFR